MNKISAPVLSYSIIKKQAEFFLDKHHKTRIIPIPIDEIIELKLGIKLTAVSGLKEKFDIDGFINSRCDEITIDSSVFEKYLERTRFTLAHEIGHMILHKEIYCVESFNTPEEYSKYQNNISNEDYDWLERQANIFAGCVLVPDQPLKEEVDRALSNQLTKEEDFAIPYLEFLPEKFKVSSMVLFRRIKKEGLLK